MSEIIPYPDELDLDPDGYPDDEWIARLQRANDVTNAGRWLLEAFPRFVERIGYGRCVIYDGRDDFGGPIKVIQFSTGGWSGQEDLIGAIERSFVGMFYLWSWRRGGHYEFRVPTKSLA